MRSYCLWVAVFACCALLLYELKYNVHNAQKKTHELEQTLIEERERLHMVELEWTRLSRPERIAALAEKHLQLRSMVVEHIMPQEVAMWKISSMTAEYEAEQLQEALAREQEKLTQEEPE